MSGGADTNLAWRRFVPLRPLYATCILGRQPFINSRLMRRFRQGMEMQDEDFPVTSSVVQLMSAEESKFSAEILRDVSSLVRSLEQDAKASALIAAKHNRRRVADAKRKKAKYKSSAQKKRTPSFLLAIDSESKKERKNHDFQNSKLIDQSGKPTDDWPEDFADQFWNAWPEHPRKYALSQVVTKLGRIRKSGVVTWAVLFGQLGAYFDSGPEAKFIPAPMIWLNQARWTANYSVPLRKKTFMDIAMGRG